MNRFKSLVAATALTFVFAVGAGAQGPCPPGETLTPPCKSVTTDAPAPSDPLTLPESESLEIVSLVELAFESLLLF